MEFLSPVEGRLEHIAMDVTLGHDKRFWSQQNTICGGVVCMGMGVGGGGQGTMFSLKAINTKGRITLVYNYLNG